MVVRGQAVFLFSIVDTRYYTPFDLHLEWSSWLIALGKSCPVLSLVDWGSKVGDGMAHY